MQVITLDPSKLEAHTARLAEMVEKSDESFDAICGIERGGAKVADIFCRHFPNSRYCRRSDIKLQRPSTKRKRKWMGAILRRLPIALLDLLRMAEARLLALKSHHGAERWPEIEASIRKDAEEGKIRKILIIDDAIDSGDTLWSIVEALKRMNPEIGIKTAVITQTTRQPRIRPDFTIYNNQTLIRFPWSEDYRKKNQ